MKNLLFVLALSLPTVSCGDDSGGNGNTCGTGTVEVNGVCEPEVTCGAGTMAMDGMCIPTPGPGTTFVQVEHLARPGINEALLFTAGFNDGYNATAPSFTGVPQATLDQVVTEAKTVLKALYLGGCLINGQLGLTEANGVHPGGATCDQVGAALFEADGETLKASVVTAATAYADRIFAQFVPDVMRIDVGTAGNRPVSTYLKLCGSPNDAKPLLCGGRGLRDDVIDITYDYFLNGAATCSSGIPALCPGGAGTGACTGGNGLCGASNQVNALVSDGVVFDPANNNTNVSSRQDGTAANTQQGHTDVTTEFPYSAVPF